MRARVAAALLALSLLDVGCATKSYVRHQLAPLSNHVNTLDDVVARNSRDLKAADDRATQSPNALAIDASTALKRLAEVNAQSVAAQHTVANVSEKIGSMEATLANVDRYRNLTERSVRFKSGEKRLTLQSCEVLDELVANIPKALNYLIVVEGATDATGPNEYNIALSQQRAEAVVHYLAIKHRIPTYRMRWIGIGVNKPVAPNNTAKRQAENRRADVVLLVVPDIAKPQDQESDADDETWARSARPQPTFAQRTK